jgi:hypothetical protein
MKSQREEEAAVAGVKLMRGKVELLGSVHSKDTQFKLPTSVCVLKHHVTH